MCLLSAKSCSLDGIQLIRVKVSLITGEFWHFLLICYHSDYFYSRMHSSRSSVCIYVTCSFAFQSIYGHKQLIDDILCTSQLKPSPLPPQTRGTLTKGIWQRPWSNHTKTPGPGENLEIKFPSPWEQIGKGLKTTNKQTNQKETVHTELIRNKIYFNKAIVTKRPCCGLLNQLQEYEFHIATEHFWRVLALKMLNSTFSAKPLSTRCLTFADCRQQTADFRLQITDCIQCISDCRL